MSVILPATSSKNMWSHTTRSVMESPTPLAKPSIFMILAVTLVLVFFNRVSAVLMASNDDLTMVCTDDSKPRC